MVCAVACCKPHYPPGTSFHRFPKKDKHRAAMWEQACKRKDMFNTKTARICSQHFDRDQFEQRKRSEILYGKIEMRLKNTAVPTLLLHPRQAPAPVVSDRSIRQKRREHAKATAEEKAAMDKNNNVEKAPAVTEDSPEDKIRDLELQVAGQAKTISMLKLKLQSSQRQVRRLKEQKKKVCPSLSKTKKVQIAKEILLKSSSWSPQQVNFLLQGKTKASWASDDIVLGLTLRAASRRTYQILRKKKLLPLPSLTTLREHVRHFKCNPGLQHDVLKGI